MEDAPPPSGAKANAENPRKVQTKQSAQQERLNVSGRRDLSFGSTQILQSSCFFVQLCVVPSLSFISPSS